VLGFAFVIQRNVAEWCPSPSRPITFVDKHLNIKIFAHAQLSNVEKEVDFFQKHNQHHFRAEVEHPVEYAGDAAVAHVTKLRGARDAHFHHYCCHGITHDTDCWQSRLWFGREKSEGLLELQDLYRAVIDACPDCECLNLSNTFSFLNACDAGVVRPVSRFSFPSLFLQSFGHLGFIGPEHRIPEAFACEFARVFYAHLLKLGHMGLALFRTRWFFAKKYNNPLGLFYTLYADPDLQLSETVDSVNL